MIRQKRLAFREAFRWESTVEEWVQKFTIGRVLNIPCGQSKIGDERVDNDGTVNPTVVSDFFEYFPGPVFDTVISDPPWGIPLLHRQRWFFHCVYLCKPGGRIIYNATWLPTSKATKIREPIMIRQSAYFGNVSILSIHEKITDALDSKNPLSKEILESVKQ